MGDGKENLIKRIVEIFGWVGFSFKFLLLGQVCGKSYDTDDSLM